MGIGIKTVFGNLGDCARRGCFVRTKRVMRGGWGEREEREGGVVRGGGRGRGGRGEEGMVWKGDSDGCPRSIRRTKEVVVLVG